MKRISAGKFEANVLEVLETVRKSQEPIMITKRGKPLVKVIPVEVAPKRFLGRLRGVVQITGDIESPVIDPKLWKSGKN